MQATSKKLIEHAIMNENSHVFILAYSSNDNDIIRRSFQFPYNSSLVNESNNYLDLPISQEQKNKMTLL